MLFDLTAQRVDRLDDQENDDRHNEEIDGGGDERADIQRRDARALCRFDGRIFAEFAVERDEQFIGKIEALGEKADDGHDHVVDQRIDDRLERAADNDTDGKVHGVALGDKFPKFLNKLPLFFHIHPTFQ